MVDLHFLKETKDCTFKNTIEKSYAKLTFPKPDIFAEGQVGHVESAFDT